MEYQNQWVGGGGAGGGGGGGGKVGKWAAPGWVGVKQEMSSSPPPIVHSRCQPLRESSLGPVGPSGHDPGPPDPDTQALWERSHPGSVTYGTAS